MLPYPTPNPTRSHTVTRSAAARDSREVRSTAITRSREPSGRDWCHRRIGSRAAVGLLEAAVVARQHGRNGRCSTGRAGRRNGAPANGDPDSSWDGARWIYGGIETLSGWYARLARHPASICRGECTQHKQLSSSNGGSDYLYMRSHRYDDTQRHRKCTSRSGARR